MASSTESENEFLQQQLLLAAQMQNGPACEEDDDEPYEEVETRYFQAYGAYMTSKSDGGVSPEEEKIFNQIQAQYTKRKSEQNKVLRTKSETTVDSSKRRRASSSPLFVQQDQPDHHERCDAINKPTGSKRKRSETSKNSPKGSKRSKVDDSMKYSINRLIANAPANKKQSAIRDGKRILHAVKQFPSGTVEYDGGGTWSVKGMKTSLRHHQLINAGHMKERENNATGPKGGILADEMGYGKTISALASMVHGDTMFGTKELKTNLVIVRKSIKTQWCDEAHEHAERLTPHNTSGLGRIHMYNPANSTRTELREFKDAGVVIATYTELDRGFKNFPYPKNFTEAEKEKYFDEQYRPNLSALLQYLFRAVYLDEGHDIRNSKARRTMACQKIQSKFFWVLTGTPMTNNPTDLYSALVFIRDPTVCKLTLKEFNDKYKGASKKNIKVEWIANTLKHCMSRWTRQDEFFGRQVVDIPKSKNKDICKDLSAPEMIIYLTVAERLKTLAMERSTNSKNSGTYSYIDGLLMVLRQMTGHVLLIRPEIFKNLTDDDMSAICEKIKGSPLGDPFADDYIAALRKLQRSLICTICKQKTQDIRWAECHHAYCEACLDDRMHLAAERELSSTPCELCRIPMGQLTAATQDNEDETPRWLNEKGKVIPSTKSSVVVELLMSWRHPGTGGSRAKAVVFTRFKECHKFLGATFREQQWKFTVLTADMSSAQRDKSVADFTDNPDMFIMLAMNGVGGLGLNLTAAKCVFAK